MPKKFKADVSKLLQLAGPTLRASTAKEFMEGVRQGFEGVYTSLMEGADQPRTLSALKAALSASDVPIRHRKALELCVWPIFDKPMLPQNGSGVPEFLWLYSLPFVVQFSTRGAERPIQFSEDVFDMEALTQAVYQSGRLSAKAVLGGFPTLFTREDLQRQGAPTLATAAVCVSTGLGQPGLTPGGLEFDSDIECARVATFFVVGTARMPAGERTLMNPSAAWPPEGLERLILAGLTEQGFEVETVTSMAPCSMAETLLRCTSTGHLEFCKVLALAQQHYALTGVSIEHSGEGWAELHATIRGEQDAILILPAFAFVEPRDELQGCIQQCCLDLGIPFKGAFSVALPISSMLH
jgi:hypothetical protein